MIGCGPIGLFAIQWMRMMGASDVIAVDVSPKKLELAREAGANIRVLSSEFDENTARADLVVEAVGLDVTINSAVMLAAPSGHVSFIGIPVPDLTLSTKTFQTFLRQGMSLHGS